MTCGYAEGVDGINTARPFTRTATAQQDTAAESALRFVAGQRKCAQCVFLEESRLGKATGQPIRLRI